MDASRQDAATLEIGTANRGRVWLTAENDFTAKSATVVLDAAIATAELIGAVSTNAWHSATAGAGLP